MNSGVLGPASLIKSRAVEITNNVISDQDQVQAIYIDIRSRADHFCDLFTL